MEKNIKKQLGIRWHNTVESLKKNYYQGEGNIEENWSKDRKI